jgi:P-type conjugative transfer protein TrbJ
MNTFSKILSRYRAFLAKGKTESSSRVATWLFYTSMILVFAFMLLLFAAAFPRPAHAGGGGGLTGGATEVTQIANNVELAMINVEEVTQTIQDELRNIQLIEQTYLGRLQQLKESIGQYTAPFQKAYATYKKVVETKNKLLGVAHSIENFDEVLKSRYREFAATTLDWKSYLDREQRLIQGGDLRAREKLKANIAVLEDAQESIETYQNTAKQMESTVGVHGATQILGAQLAMVGQDINKLIAITAQANASKAAQEQERAAIEERTLEHYKKFIDEVKAERERRLKQLDAMDRITIESK